MQSDRLDLVGDCCPPQNSIGRITRGATFKATAVISGADFSLSDVTEIVAKVREKVKPYRLLATWRLTTGQFNIITTTADGGTFEFLFTDEVTAKYRWTDGDWGMSFELSSGEKEPVFHGEVEVFHAPQGY